MPILKLIYRILFPLTKLLLYPSSTIKSYLFSKTRIGKGVYISKHCSIWETHIDDYCFIGEHSTIDNVSYIGKYTSISKYVHIGLGAHPHEKFSTSPVFYSPKRGFVKESKYVDKTPPTIIKNDVLIGANSCIMQGVTINNGAIVGAGSVVTKDIPPYAIAVGNPAKIIRYRFDKETCEKLEKSNWWELNIQDLQKYYDQPINTIISSVNNKNN